MVDFGDDPEFWTKACAVVIPYTLLYGFVAWRAHSRARDNPDKTHTAGRPAWPPPKRTPAAASHAQAEWRLTY